MVNSTKLFRLNEFLDPTGSDEIQQFWMFPNLLEKLIKCDEMNKQIL